MCFADISPAQEAYAFPSQVHDDNDVLIGVRLLLLPTVVEGLFFRAFRPLSTPFGAAGLMMSRGSVPVAVWLRAKSLGFRSGRSTLTIESISQDGQQPMDS